MIAGPIDILVGNASVNPHFGSTFDIAEDGRLTNRQRWGHIDGVSPDGICLDADGAFWVANGQATQCLRVGPGGEVLATVDVGRTAFACALAADEPVLYVVVGDSFGPDILERANGQVVAIPVDTPASGVPMTPATPERMIGPSEGKHP